MDKFDYKKLLRNPAAYVEDSVSPLVNVESAKRAAFAESHVLENPMNKNPADERTARQQHARNLNGGPADAYRHMIISAELTRRFGPAAGRAMSEAHELRNLGDSYFGPNAKHEKALTEMDRHNNAIGAEIGTKAQTWEDVVRMAREKIAESAKTDGDGQEGRASWINKTGQSFEPKWKTDEIRNYDLGSEKEKYGSTFERLKAQTARDLDTVGSMEYEGFHSAFDLEQKQPVPDAAKNAGREAGPDQRSDAGDASQQQQFAAANADTGIDTGGIDTGTIDTGGGNNGRNYAAELAALPLGREVSLNWLLEKSPDQWTQPELDDAQASDAYWNSRNLRHADVQ
ncbi:hypothetical protein, partial [Ferrovibrio sp.]|uniref:DUF6973 domain-containing protein n=1 Tax=Ferrovibrio sp. TaxID=1917215 RepID=UPI0025BD67CB